MALPVPHVVLNPSLKLFSQINLSLPVSTRHSVLFSASLLKTKHFFTRNDVARREMSKKWLKAAPIEESKVSSSAGDAADPPQHKLRILVAGGGIGGLVFALAAKRKGFEVLVLERDVSAIRGEGKYRGPIQIQSNALAALEAIDLAVADEIMDAACITGDRINGLVDGISGTWYVKFDTFTPAVERGLPVTRVISRTTLQQILANAVGEDTIINDSNVIDFEDDGTKVTVILENGQRYEGDLLVGADGIWSKVRKRLFGPKEATYSGYTCYTGIADFVPADIETVGYRVFLGYKQYFVSSDVGGGKMQWYAFHKEPPGGVDAPNGKKERLLQIFHGWCDNVIDLIHATDEEAILRRDIYDQEPVFTWGKDRVTLLGDSIHAMQPNLGQGGCMAIEDSYQLALELEKAWKKSVDSGIPIDISSSLKQLKVPGARTRLTLEGRYERERRLRVVIIHGLARMAAKMASTYRPYLGVGLGPLLIQHWGIVGGRSFFKIAMPLVLNWVLGGNRSNLEGRLPSCRLSDKANSQLRKWFEDDDALERALNAEWYLFPTGNEYNGGSLHPIHLSRDENKPCTIGNISQSNLPGASIAVPLPKVSKMHARIHCKDNAFYVTDLHSQHGTWIADNKGKHYRVPPNLPVRFHPYDCIEFGSNEATYRVKVLKDLPETATNKASQLLEAARKNNSSQL